MQSFRYQTIWTGKQSPSTQRYPLRALSVLPIILLLVWSPFSVAKEEMGWSGTGELGYVANSGNTESETVTTALDTGYRRERWLFEEELSWLRSTAPAGEADSKQEQVIANRFQAALQANYDLSERFYAFTTARYEKDKFGAFEYRYSGTLGLGARLLDEEHHTLKTEVGAGQRRSKIFVDPDAADADREGRRRKRLESILRARAEHGWNFTDSAKWTNRLMVEAGEDNLYSEFQTGLTVDINDSLAVKVAWSLYRNSDVPEGREPVDRLLTVNLVIGLFNGDD